MDSPTNNSDGDGRAPDSSGRDEHTSPLIELICVSRHYEAGQVHALENVSLTIGRGEFLVILGPSGCGKTTLLNLMSGLDQPSSGAVVFNGRQPAGVREWARLRSRKIGFVFQSFHLLPTLSALENVEIPMFGTESTARERTERAQSLLAQVGLAGKAARRPGELSGGEKQRVAIARSLANAPGIVLADEPTGNLDSTSAAAVLEILVRLTREHGVTVVMVTHNNTIARDADRVVEFVDGRIARIEERRATA